MYQAIIVIHVLLALSIIGLVLLQQGRGADAGVGLSGGASSTLFGSRGTASFLSRTTSIMAALFFTTSILLAYLGSKTDNSGGDVMSTVEDSKTSNSTADLPTPAASSDPSKPTEPSTGNADVPSPAQP